MSYVWLIPLGLVVGAYGTLIGAGGGFVLMPVLLLLYPDEPPELLTSISLAVVFANAASGSAAYARMKRIDYKSGLLLAAASIPGAVLGAIAVEWIPRHAFDILLGVVMVLASAFLIARPVPLNKPAHVPGRDVTSRFGSYSLPTAVMLSLLIGFVSSLLGIGGGIIHVPVLVHLLHFPVHVATATSHFVLAFMALAGTGVHVATGIFAHGVRRTIMLAVGVVIGAQFGAWASGRVRGRWLIRALAVALGLVGIRVLLLGFQR